MRPSTSPESPPGPSLLVPQTSFLGDVVLTTPLIAALRQRLRPRRLAILVRPDAASLLDGHPDIDDILVDDKRGATRGVGGVVRMARRLRRARFDLSVSPHRSLRTAIVLAAARIPRRIGFADRRGAFPYHQHIPLDRPPHPPHP